MVRSYPSVWRVSMIALFLALVGNFFLFWITRDDDWFANIIAWGSLIAAIGLIVARYVRQSLVGEVLLLATAVWVANAIEFATEDGPIWQSQCRQCGFYGAFAILSIGCYVATREA